MCSLLKENAMVKNTGTEHVTPADGNIFTDLGFPAAQAESFYADALCIIALKMAARGKAVTDTVAAGVDTAPLGRVPDTKR